MEFEIKKLIKEALDAREKSYSPYSNFGVGSALLAKSGKIYKGCNVESATYTPTNCAERTSMFTAIVEGEREFVAIAVVGGKKGKEIADYAFPCGVCRQVLREFCNPKEFQIIVAKSEEDYIVTTLEDILPYSFSGENLDR